jgi:hypothetical protein
MPAMSASALASFTLRKLTAASRRFDDFVRELARFNEHFGRHNDGYASYRAALAADWTQRRGQKPAQSRTCSSTAQRQGGES